VDENDELSMLGLLVLTLAVRKQQEDAWVMKKAAGSMPSGPPGLKIIW
jgi:hypothetical protein